MSGTALRIIITLVLLFHGVGHFMGVIPALGLVDVNKPSTPNWLKNWSSRSWLLTDLLGDSLARAISLILFLAALILTIGTALALAGWLVPHDWWQTLAIVSAVVSLAAVLLFWNALIFLVPHKVGAIGINVAVLICVLWFNWPTEAALGY